MASGTETVPEINVGERSFALWPQELSSAFKYRRKILRCVASRTDLYPPPPKKKEKKRRTILSENDPSLSAPEN